VEQIKTREAELENAIKGKAVLLGFAAAGLDFVPTTLHGRCPGVMVHGAIVNGVLTNTFPRRAADWINALLILGLGGLTVSATTYFTPIRALLIAVALAGIYLFVNCVILFAKYHVIANLTGPLASILVGWGGCSLMRFLRELAERARITRRFSTYVDPTLVNFVLKHPETDVFEGQVREMTVVFSDLAGFTTMSEKLGERSVSLLNEYLEVMVPIIRKGGAYLNKFLGDGIMFFYGAPEHSPTHAADAVRTALALQHAMKELNERFAVRGLGGLSMRIGISTGNMIVGDAGSSERADYTVLGDAVNLAARLESANKYMGTAILMGSRTVEMLDGQFLVRPVAKLQVKGKTEGIMTYEALCRSEEATPEMREESTLSKLVIDAFTEARFNDCLLTLKELEGRCGGGALVELYRLNCRRFMMEPPGADFTGEIILESK